MIFQMRVSKCWPSTAAWSTCQWETARWSKGRLCGTCTAWVPWWWWSARGWRWTKLSLDCQKWLIWPISTYVSMLRQRRKHLGHWRCGQTDSQFRELPGAQFGENQHHRLGPPGNCPNEASEVPEFRLHKGEWRGSGWVVCFPVWFEQAEFVGL